MVCQDLEKVTAPKKVLVVGWYNKGNLGDEAFKKCFHHLFPAIDFTFVYRIPANVNSYHCVWFGGGDLFCEEIPNCHAIKIPIGIIGVGYNNIHPANKQLFDSAKLVITRNASPYIEAADLCFCLPLVDRVTASIPKLVSIFLNDFLTPRKNAPDWIRTAHAWFTSEFSNVCDGLVDEGYRLQFIPFCVNASCDDRQAAAMVLSQMNRRDAALWNTDTTLTHESIMNVIQASSLVVTQRLHGSIFSLLSGTPQISINHHDKMHKFCEAAGITSGMEYYGFNKSLFFDKLKQSNNAVSDRYIQASRLQWNELSTTITQAFNL